MSEPRKLLPYEHQLIEALGVSQDEYLEFLAAQFDYTSSLEERQSVIRAATPAETYAITALVLTVIGAIFQVAAVLLAPRPTDPRRAQRQSRDQRFSPRYGFNSSQDLANYGDVVNLVYCNTNQNPLGAVRMGTSLVWSSVESFGSSQFMQLLLVLGASRIRRIDYDRVAFGQLPLGDFNAAKTWLYYEQNGRPLFNDKVLGDGKDPTRDGAPGTDPVCKVLDGGKRKEGYSQAFSPTSLVTCGVYDPIPVNVQIMERRTSGRVQWADNQVTIRGANWQTGNNQRWGVGERFTLVFAKAAKRDQKVAPEAAKELRYQYVSALDLASIYMIGTAKFKMVSISDDVDLDKNQVVAEFECIESGRRPSTAYDRTKARQYSQADFDALEQAEEILKEPYEELTNSGLGTLEGGSVVYFGRLRGITDTEEDALQNVKPDAVRINFGGVSYNFSGTHTVAWRDELDERKTRTIYKGGSIAYTKKSFEAYMADIDKLSTKKLRAELEDDLEQARQLRDEIAAGKHKSALRKEAKNNALAKKIKAQIRDLKKNLETKLDNSFKKNANNQGLLKSKGTGISAGSEKIADLENQIDDLQEAREDILSNDVDRIADGYITFIRNSRAPFTLFGNRYAGGIKYLKERLRDISGEQTADVIGTKAVRSYFRQLIKEKEEALKYVKYVTKNWDELQASLDDNFYTKALVKVDAAAYQTVTSCDFVKFALRARLFRRVSGRQKEYGRKDAPEAFKLSDNGLKGRMAFFKVLYRVTGTTNYTSPPFIVAVRRSTDQDNFIQLNFQAGTTAKRDFKLEPIGDIGAEIQDSGQGTFAFIENTGKRSRFKHGADEFWWVGDKVTVTPNNLKPALEERGPWYTNEWDLFSVRSDTRVQFSFENGPEFSITAVTEQQLGSVTGKYQDMSTMAFGVFSGRGVQDLRSVSAYVLEGKNSWVVNAGTGAYSLSDSSTSYAPDIFADTVLDRNDGIGKYARAEGIDWSTLALAKRFCQSNNLGCQMFMDGVIAEAQSWREFWAEAAPYSLLEFAKIGGKETLIPAVPVDSGGRANRQVNISALFNQGNILEGSYKEEFLNYGDAVQDIVATVIYRETESQDVFPRNSSVTVQLRDTAEDAAVLQTFDLSQFVTQRKQAELYGKLMCNQRRWVRRAIEFRTFPTDSPISPGAYIYVDIGLNTWDRVSSGVVLDGGVLNSPLQDQLLNGTYNVLVHKTGQATKALTNIEVVNGVASELRNYPGHLYVLGIKTSKHRVFRVTEVEMDEEGEVTVRGMEYPCEQSGSLLLSRVANFSDELFTVR